VSDPAAEWQATFDAIRDPVAVVDRSGRVVRCNRAMSDLAIDEGRARDLIALTRAAVAVEVEITGRFWRATLDPIPGGSTAVLTLVDLTERRQLEQELGARARALAEADQRKDDYLAMLAHELRNPIGAISMANYLLDQISARTPEAIRLRRTVSRQAKHLARLVDDLLDVSRLTHDRVDLRRTRVDLRVSIEDGVKAVATRMSAARHVLQVTLPSQPVWVLADPTRLEQIVANLLDNAAKYTEPGGHVTLSLECANGCASLRVCDSGLGISSEALPHVFDLFAQGPTSIDRSRGGLGIGLTVVRKLAEMHGGSVTASSAGPGQGSEFVVKLPLLLEETAGLVSAGSTLPPVCGRSRRILVIDDNEDARQAMRTLLEMWGHAVDVAADGPEGLAKALAEPPDVALVDIGLPGLDGYSLAERVRAEEREGRMLLVAVTGYGSACDRARALAAGFDAHMVKPVDPAALSRLLAG
jgi:two-component system, sensor histidine kinase